MPALTHGRVKNKFTPNAYTSHPPRLRWTRLQNSKRKNMNHKATRRNEALSKPGTIKNALTVGTIGTSAATKRAWKRRARHTTCPSKCL